MKSLRARLIFTFLISLIIDIPTGVSIIGAKSIPVIAAASLLITAVVVIFSELPFLRKSLVLIPISFIIFYRYIPSVIREIAAFLIWTAGFIYGDYPLDMRYAFILMVVSCLLIAYCTYSLIQEKKYVFYIGLGGFSILAAQSYIGVGIASTATLIFALALIFLLVYQQGGFSDHYSTLWVTVLTIFIFSITYFMPPAFEPFEVDKIKGLASVIFKNYTASGVNSESGHEYVELGGPRTLNENVVMRVVSPESTYLRGRVYDEYDGRGWHKTEYRWNLLQDNSHIEPDFDEHVSFRSIVQEVTKYGPGETIYTAYSPLWLDLNSNSVFYIDEDYEIRSGNTGERSYEVTSAIPYVDFEKLKRSGYDYPQDIRKYLQLPQGLPTRVGDLATVITEDVDNPYDKAVALQDYLRSLTYELNAPKPPADRDFADYFLFDLKEGYCTYFATAMTVMLRTQGIPARYVEGYVMPPEPDSGTVYYVRNSMAHAWVEVYFNDFGWMSFDPTPLYQGFDYSPVSGELYTITDNPAIPDNEISQETKTNEEIKSSPDLMTFEYSPYYWLLTPLFICLIVIIITHIKAYFLMKRLSKTDLVLYYNNRIVNILKRMDVKIENGETMREYFTRVSETIGLSDIINIYESTLYGKKVPMDDDVDKMRIKYEDALKVYRKKMGILFYLAGRAFELI
ncbi:MAG: transglutaminaseTgpA domain-containing protein [Thermoanaerobacteraceae bacterium]|nr:transglutaminaseTgpA domain-containing protein [Thermoanaerobacteraceae bacterium]